MIKRDDDIYNRIGIYAIRNLVNDKVYVGKTGMNFGDRRDSHFSLLRCGKHDNKHLQNAWNLYGEDNFEFVVIEDCSVEELNKREQYWIAYYKNLGQAYNIHDGGDGGNNLGKHLSEETKRKIGEKNKINGTGRILSDETKEKMKISHLGKSYSPMSEEGKLNIQRAQQEYSEKHPKKLTPKDVVEIRRLHNEENRNYSSIARDYNVTSQCISDICNYKRWKQI